MFGFIIWIISAVVSGMVGSGKGRTGAGWALGILLGPIGLLIIAVMPANIVAAENKAIGSGEMKKCPYCAELVKHEAIVCKHCGKDLSLESPVEIKAEENTEICPHCKKISEKRYNICEQCGKMKR